MSISNSVVVELLQSFPHLRAQMYFKSSLIALSHAMEDRVLAESNNPLVIASFQKERFYRQESHRYRRIAEISEHVYVLAAPETEFKNSSQHYETIAFAPTDVLAQEWHLIIISDNYASCLICREKISANSTNSLMDPSRRFEGIWSFERDVTKTACAILLDSILTYRPELNIKIQQARKKYLRSTQKTTPSINNSTDPFVERLIAYLQAGQYKLLKANKSLLQKEQKERLINSVTTAIRHSFHTEEILQIAVEKLGEGLKVCRTLVYRCDENALEAIIEHEFLREGIISVKGFHWPIKHNPLFQQVLELKESLPIDNARTDARITQLSAQKGELVENIVQTCSIFSWLLVPVLYQGKLLGMLELHHCEPTPITWKNEDIALVNAIATQIGVALIQAEAYVNLQDLNEQLEALERTRSNLVAITGHELRTPLSTIKVCLESLATEPDMPLELRQVMLDTALTDAERMRKLIQDFLTLSELESGRVQWHVETISLEECIQLAIANVSSRYLRQSFASIIFANEILLPLVEVDGEWLVEVLVKLLDNACKFTPVTGQITIEAKVKDDMNLEVIISDTGRGIESNRLEQVFERFYQEEGALRRTTGGTGLGLAICRQIVQRWNGQIWAQSSGKDKGSQFHFTIPVVRASCN